MIPKVPSRPKNAGFTLIEVLVVLIIVGILATAGFNSLGSRSPRAVKSGLMTMRAALFDARQAALSSGQAVKLNMTWDGKNVCKITGGSMQYTMEPSILRYSKLATKVADLPDTTVQGLQAAISFGFASSSTGWDTNLVSTNAYGFSPTGQPVAIDNAGVMTPLPGGFWLGLVGRTPNTKGVPYGVLLIADKGQIISFYKGDSALSDTPEHKWQRLE